MNLTQDAQKSFQNQARFGTDLGSENDTQMAPKIDPRSLPRRSWNPVSAGCCFRTRFSYIFDPPEPEKTLKSAVTSSLFVVFAILSMARLGTKKAPQHVSKMTPKSGPGSLQKPKNDDKK